MGAAFVANGISGDHRRYLALGGLGFILGDGGLNYGLEKIFETYYTAHVWRGISVAVDYQHVTEPGIQPRPRSRFGGQLSGSHRGRHSVR